MKSYWVIYDEVEGRYDDQTHNIRAVGCNTKEVAEKHILQHPEAIIIYGERWKVGIIPEHVKWASKSNEEVEL
jgi:hypothetical protein